MTLTLGVRFVAGVLVATCLAHGPRTAMAAVPAKAIAETVELFLKRYGDDMLRESTETVTEQLTKVVATYGDEGLDAMRKVGPRGIKVIQEAGENGLDVVKIISRYGDDALWVVSRPKGMAIFIKYGDDAAKVLIKHKGIAEDMIEAHGKSAVAALKAVGAREARQVAILQKDGVIQAGQQGDALLDVIGQHGDRAMDFIWRNKGALAITAGLVTFIADPEPYINGTKELVVEGVSRPVSEMGKEVARNTSWTVLGIAGIGMLGGLAAWKAWLKKCLLSRICG